MLGKFFPIIKITKLNKLNKVYTTSSHTQGKRQIISITLYRKDKMQVEPLT